jgi:Tol biopolymer transport system component
VIRVAWVGRDGREQEPVFDKESWVMAPRVSPDGTRIALSSYRPNVPGEIWLIDPARRSEIRLTQADDSQIVAWSRGGTMLAVLQSSQEGTAIWRIDVAHGGRRELWKKISGLATVDSWLAGDRGILFTRIADETRTDIWSLDAAPGAEPQPLLATPAAEHSAEASPDGKWFAYVRDMTGREEVYVQRLGGAASPWKVSDNGGNDPRWRADGRELYYVAPGGRLNAVATTLGESFAAGPPKKLFTAALDESGTRQYDAAPDGSRFVMNLKRTPVDSPIVVVLGAGSEVRRKL